MDKKIAGLLGAAAALTAVNTAQAAAPATAAIGPAAVSYRDLLEPIPNALALLKNEDTQGTEARTDGQTRLVQHTSSSPSLLSAVLAPSPSSSPPLLSPPLLRSRNSATEDVARPCVLAVVMLFV